MLLRLMKDSFGLKPPKLYHTLFILDSLKTDAPGLKNRIKDGLKHTHTVLKRVLARDSLLCYQMAYLVLYKDTVSHPHTVSQQ